MYGDRPEMTDECLRLAGQNIFGAITAESLGSLSNRDLHSLLLVLRSHREREQLLLEAHVVPDGSVAEIVDNEEVLARSRFRGGSNFI